MQPWQQCYLASWGASPWKPAMPATCRIKWRTNSPAASELGGFWQPMPPLAWLRQRRPPQLEPECQILDLSSGMDKGTCRSLLLSPAVSDTENGSKRKRSRLRNDWWGKRRNTAGGPLRKHPFLKGKWTLEPAQSGHLKLPTMVSQEKIGSNKYNSASSHIPCRKSSGQTRQQSPTAENTSPPTTPRTLWPPFQLSTTTARSSTGADLTPAKVMDAGESGVNR